MREVVDLVAVSAERQKWRGCRVIDETGRADEQRDGRNVPHTHSTCCYSNEVMRMQSICELERLGPISRFRNLVVWPWR